VYCCATKAIFDVMTALKGIEYDKDNNPDMEELISDMSKLEPSNVSQKKKYIYCMSVLDISR